MPEFLLEVGCEELPASFVEKAYSDLAESLGKELEALGIKNSDPVCMGTPRRLIVSFPDLLVRQEDSVKEQRGPSLSAAYDQNGEPTGALKGFCKSQGVDVTDLRKDDQYVWVTKQIPGRPTAEILAEIVPKAILGLNFDKSMRCPQGFRFARPIRWILAAYDRELVPFNIEYVSSNLISYGHRFYSPGIFEAKSFNDLVTELRARLVEPDVEVRKESILNQTREVAGGVAEISESLLDENAFLCEWPTAISGTFSESFLDLPEPVLVTAMAKHERMFPVRDGSGKLTNSFVFIRNSGENNTVRRGCEWVLGARFNDAKFFYAQDKRQNLDDFLAKTEGVIFQAKLGTVRQRIDRLMSLAKHIALNTGADSQESQYAEEAAKYAKVDLVTGLVSELSSLQGVIGSEYALREGMTPEVASAIAHQYDLKDVTADTAAGRTAIRLCIADQLDKLAGYLGLGLEPSGSSDPFGLRRAVTVLIDCSERWSGAMPSFDLLLEAALSEYERQGFDLKIDVAHSALAEIFVGRYASMYSEFKKDVMESAMLRENRAELTTPKSVLFRAKVSELLSGDALFLQTAIRPMNIVAAAKRKSIEFKVQDALDHVESGKLNSTEGTTLLEMLRAQRESVHAAANDRDVQGLADLLLKLVDPINGYFENTMVMSEDSDERYHRLSLANAAAEQLVFAGDFTKIGG